MMPNISTMIMPAKTVTGFRIEKRMISMSVLDLSFLSAASLEMWPLEGALCKI
jgi:hypothetical protein